MTANKNSEMTIFQTPYMLVWKVVFSNSLWNRLKFRSTQTVWKKFIQFYRTSSNQIALANNLQPESITLKMTKFEEGKDVKFEELKYLNEER